MFSVVGCRVEDGDKLGHARRLASEVQKPGNVHACVDRSQRRLNRLEAVAHTLSTTVNLLDRAEANTGQIVALASDHRGDKAVLGDGRERNAEDGVRRGQGRRGSLVVCGKWRQVQVRSNLATSEYSRAWSCPGLLRARFILVKKPPFSGALGLATGAGFARGVDTGMPICDLRDSERLLDCEDGVGVSEVPMLWAESRSAPSSRCRGQWRGSPRHPGSSRTSP